MTATVHALDVLDASGGRRSLVLKRYTMVDPSEPDQAYREGHILQLVATIGVPTPEVIALDRDGTESGLPSILMTRIPGRVILRPSSLRTWIRELAALLPPIHAASIPRDALPAYRPYSIPEPAVPPAWAARPDVWRRAVERFTGPMPPEPACFIHRDFHPGNVLWAGGRPSGVIDWLHGCWGSPSADLGHCRLNLWGLHGREAADAFVEEYRKLVPGAPPYDLYWDLAAAVGGFSDLDGRRRKQSAKPWRRWRLMEEIVEAALGG